MKVYQVLWRLESQLEGGYRPVSSNGTESYATHRHHSPSSLGSSGLRRGRSSPRATASESAKEYRP
jgi:hypothetical protein